MAGSTVKQLSAVCLRQPLQQRASFYCQNIQRYFQLIDSGSKFWVSSNLLLKRIQNLLSAGNMLGGFGGILLGVAFALRFHGYSLLCSILNQYFPVICSFERAELTRHFPQVTGLPCRSRSTYASAKRSFSWILKVESSESAMVFPSAGDCSGRST